MLLEVIMATALMTIGLFAIIEGLGRCVAASSKVQRYNIAQTLLANKSYEFRVEQTIDDTDQQGAFDSYPGFSWSRTLERAETNTLYKQTITVFWYERGEVTSDAIVEYRYLPQSQR
jgi:hypothetical protein